MNLESEVMTLRKEVKLLTERNNFLERQHSLDIADATRLRRMVDFFMESQGLKNEKKEEILDDQ